ncbi:MAG: hypothetical protein IH852_11480 [Bacteroidetes bacterium]|nr:hypothetical protein [Bacteroidota bacterium]
MTNKTLMLNYIKRKWLFLLIVLFLLLLNIWVWFVDDTKKETEFIERPNLLIENTDKNILWLKLSNDVLAVIIITLIVFIVGGMARSAYDYYQKWDEKRKIKDLVGISVKFMDERISKQIDYLLTFVDVLKNKNIKDLNFTMTYPYQIKTILTISNIDLYMAYKKDNEKYNQLITNINLIDVIFDELKKLHIETKVQLKGYEEDWYKSNRQLVQMYNNFRVKTQNGDILFDSIRPLYVDWMKYGNTKDLVRALEFIKDFIKKCKEHIPDSRALSFLHLANDISNIIENYQSTTKFYSGAFNEYKDTLTRANQELKEAIA